MPQENLRAFIFTSPFEHHIVAGFLTSQDVTIYEGTVYETSQFTGNNLVWDVGLAQIEADDITSTVVQAKRAIAYFKPHVIFLIGVAIGIQDVLPGDVVVATEIYGYRHEKSGEVYNLPFEMLGFGSYGLQQCARTEAQQKNWLDRLPKFPSPTPEVHLAPVVFEERDATSVKRSQSNYQDAQAVDPESYGFYEIARELQRPVAGIVIRGISELIDDDRRRETDRIARETAAQHASAFAFQLLANFVPDSILTDAQDDPEQSFQEDNEPISILRKPRRAQCFTESAIHLDLMLIPAGTFMMGSPPEELWHYDNEGPQHEVTVPTFLMGRYPVTQAQWRAIADRTDLKVNLDLDPDPSRFKGDDRPVDWESWYEAVEFCDRLSRLTGHTYRLPTEAEWEYACRAHTKTPFHFGESITTDLANYSGEEDEFGIPGSYGKGPQGNYREATTSVIHFHSLANSFGLCDMHGNVWEWCLDHWHDDYEGAPTDGRAWLTKNTDAGRLARGGSYNQHPGRCRSASRRTALPSNRIDHIGFRVVCEARGL
ncbi:SUMF1/EgtB/PvdO family nonheme iron enzyme [Leptolyngbya sp. PL-A3]